MSSIRISDSEYLLKSNFLITNCYGYKFQWHWTMQGWYSFQSGMFLYLWIIFGLDLFKLQMLLISQLTQKLEKLSIQNWIITKLNYSSELMAQCIVYLSRHHQALAVGHLLARLSLKNKLSKKCWLHGQMETHHQCLIVMKTMKL